MIRDDAVKTLIQHGFIAKPRDWSMGETIMVTHESLMSPRPGSDIIVYSDMVYVKYETGSKNWFVFSGVQEDYYNSLYEVIEVLKQRLKENNGTRRPG